jgi:flavodoxin
MKTRVVYYSVTGNTKKVDQAIAEAAGCRAEKVQEAAASEELDVLFLGAAIYATYEHDFHPDLKNYIKTLDRKKIKKVVVFGTYAFASSIEKLIQFAKSCGLNVADESFVCKGRFLFFNLRSPKKEDLQKAKDFAKSIAA